MSVCDAAPHAVSVEVCGEESATVLRLVAMLHRRHVDVLELEVSRPIAGRRSFFAVFRATPMQAETVARSLGTLVEVAGVELCQVAEVTDVAGVSRGEVVAPIARAATG